MEQINGREIAERVYSRIGNRSGQGLKLAVIMAGADKATESFVSQKRKAAAKTGVDFEMITLPGDAATEEVEAAVRKASDDRQITAIVTQLPFPPQVDKQRVLAAIDPKKDADSLNGGSLVPPSAGTVLEVLDYLGKDIRGLNFAVVGYGELVGKPVYDCLRDKARSVALLRRGSDLNAGLAGADVIVSGTGKFGLITPDMARDGTIVIDFGYGSDEDGNTGGDFNPGNSDKNILYTPTPGGTGPILVSKLFENIVSLKN